MTTDDAGQSKKPLAEDEVAFDYIKARDFRVVWADGAIGGVTPNGLIHLALYAERQAIPQRQVYAIEPVDATTGKLGKEVLAKRISRGSIVREMACDVFLTPQAAENLAKWIAAQLAELKKLQDTEV